MGHTFMFNLYWWIDWNSNAVYNAEAAEHWTESATRNSDEEHNTMVHAAQAQRMLHLSLLVVAVESVLFGQSEKLWMLWH